MMPDTVYQTAQSTSCVKSHTQKTLTPTFEVGNELLIAPAHCRRLSKKVPV